MNGRERNEMAAEIMTAFARSTGLIGEGPERRYLWTDAFAVCNFLGLARVTGDERHSRLALRLVDRVHHVLGRHRVDDRRSGWIAGLDEREGEAHPTRGGLRIGKELPERAPGEPFDERLEWERDGQYFHYLTRWMHALDRTARATAQPVFNAWARELAEAAHRAFAYTARGDGRRRMYWKMSIDLSRPLVPSMGQHDALDGFVTCAELQATASALPGAVAGPTLEDEAADYGAMIERDSLETDDPLGLGGLLSDAHRVAQLAGRGERADGGLMDLEDALLAAGLAGLDRYARQRDLQRPAEHRLAFRELGLAIGLEAVAALREQAASSGGRARERLLLAELCRHDPLRSRIVAFWLEPGHRECRSWVEHGDINEVMLATALAPDGLLLPPVPAGGL